VVLISRIGILQARTEVMQEKKTDANLKEMKAKLESNQEVRAI
jgi:hypothetical protein